MTGGDRTSEIFEAIEYLKERVDYDDDNGNWALRVLASLADEYESLRARVEAAEAKLAGVEQLHHPKNGEDDRGPYTICDYDKTPWPCRTYLLLHPTAEEGEKQ